jgi:uncharacterized MAPEG superfamily protein
MQGHDPPPLHTALTPSRASLTTTLGLRALPPGISAPNHASAFLILNFITAYVLGPRLAKIYFKFDHNLSPREDCAKYGEKMVTEGKLSRRSLDLIKRWEGAHENATEGFTLLLAGVLLALHAGVDTGRLNGLMAAYTVLRVGYLVSYLAIEKEEVSVIRTVCWWSGNICCLTMLALAGKKL